MKHLTIRRPLKRFEGATVCNRPVETIHCGLGLPLRRRDSAGEVLVVLRRGGDKPWINAPFGTMLTSTVIYSLSATTCRLNAPPPYHPPNVDAVMVFQTTFAA